MIGIGIDSVDIERFRKVSQRRPSFLDRVFSLRELATMTKRKDPIPGLAARFCAKEATMKAFGVGLGAFDMAEVEVVTLASGAPYLELSGRAAELATDLGVRQMNVSLTHTKALASAVVLAS